MHISSIWKVSFFRNKHLVSAWLQTNCRVSLTFQNIWNQNVLVFDNRDSCFPVCNHRVVDSIKCLQLRYQGFLLQTSCTIILEKEENFRFSLCIVLWLTVFACWWFSVRACCVQKSFMMWSCRTSYQSS